VVPVARLSPASLLILRKNASEAADWSPNRDVLADGPTMTGPMAWSEPDAAGYTAKVVVAPVLASVMVAVPAAPPVSVSVADVSDWTEMFAIDEPATPETANSEEAVSCVQTVSVPVIVIEVAGDAGTAWVEADSVATATATWDSVVPSVIVRMPVPAPVVTVTVAEVEVVMFWPTLVTPDTPESAKVVVPLDQDVPVPVRVRVIWPP
jgi:hypothetical protein